MSDTTTIEIRSEQKASLDELKQHQGEPYKSVLQSLITHYRANNTDGEGMGESRVRELAREEVNQMVVLEALE